MALWRLDQPGLVDPGHGPDINRTAGVAHANEATHLAVVKAQEAPYCLGSSLPAMPRAMAIRRQSKP